MAEPTTGGFMPNLTGGAAGPSGASLGNTSNKNGGPLTVVRGNPLIAIGLGIVAAVLLVLLLRKKKR